MLRSPGGLLRGVRYYVSRSVMSVEDSIRAKISDAFAPSHLFIRNEYVRVAHSARPCTHTTRRWPLKTVATARRVRRHTHPDFFVEVVSDQFQGKPQIARHRAVNALLASEFERGVHALSLRLKTPAEIERERTGCCSSR